MSRRLPRRRRPMAAPVRPRDPYTSYAMPAAITLARYTHALPGDVERARAQLAAYLGERREATG